MGLSTDNKKQLLKCMNIIKPNFHSFTFTFYTQLQNYSLVMPCPSSDSLNKNSYLLFCALERTIMHIDHIRSVIPFIEHHANNLSKLGLDYADLSSLSQAFMATLKIHLKERLSPSVEQHWLDAINIFMNIIKSYLFKSSNVVSFNNYSQKQLSS